MIAIQSWVDRLFKRCAKTDTENAYTKKQTFGKEIVLKAEIDKNTVPTASNMGPTNIVTFVDKNNVVMGNIECFRTNTDSTGIRLRLRDHFLGFKLSDEGIVTSFADHPYEEGPDNQIATVKYVLDNCQNLFDLFKRIQEEVRENAKSIKDLQDLVNLIQNTIKDIDKVPTKGSNNLVYSGGVYSYIETKIKDLKSYIKEEIENNIITVSSLGFSKEIKHLATKLGDDAKYEYTPDTSGILFIKGRTDYNLDIYVNGNLKFEDLTNGGEHGATTITLPVAVGNKYRLEGHIDEIWFIAFSFTYRTGDD